MVLVRNSGSLDRRRRRLTLESAGADEGTAIPAGVFCFPGEQELDPFESLTKDRLIRRLLSDRLWKHWVIVGVLVLIPLLLLMLSLSGVFADVAGGPAGRSVVGAAAGLQLFACGQLCILIAAVRAASHVDFHGRYRCWRWLSVWFFVAAFFVLSDTADLTSGGLAELFSRLIGPLQAARPALIVVPCAGVLAWVLKAVLPDMGRCRPAQVLLLSGVLLSAMCVVLQIRLGTAADGVTAGAGLLSTGLLLSAMLLQSRSVIHVNPNPPVNGLLPVGLAGMRLVAVPGGDTAVSISELSQETTLAASVEVSQDVPVEPPVQGGSRGRRRKSA
jgi:hypothetical protein